MASDHQQILDKAHALDNAVLRYNDINAMVELAYILLDNQNFVSQRARGLQLYERAIKQAAHPGAMFSLATYLLSNGDRRDCHRAVSLLERSLKICERPQVLRRLGCCYRFGEGVAIDLTLAAQLFERALRLEQDPYIMVHLAHTLLHIPHMKQQRKRAIALYKKAILLSSDATLMNGLGLLYHEGTCVVQPCPNRAAKWYKRAIRTSKACSSMYNLAVLLLDNDPSSDDVHQATRLLEDALEQEQDEEIMLKLADTYLEHELDMDRAIHLYETATFRYNSHKARSTLLGSWVKGMGRMQLSHSRIHEFCRRDFMENRNHGSFVTFGELLWTGAEHVRMNRRKAIKFLNTCRWSRHDCFSLMIRQDPSTHPNGRKAAERLLKQFDDRIDKGNVQGLESIILSESDCAGDKLLALESFRSQNAQDSSSCAITWMAPHLRISSYDLPFDGHVRCITNTMRRFALCTSLASLNLSSLLLEIEGKEQEAVPLLEGLMDTELRVIGMLNLAYILMNDIRGVKKDYVRGLQLLESAVNETNDASARAMLANALVEGTDADEGKVERAWNLWRSVEQEEDDEDELRRLRRLISASSAEKWNKLGRDDEGATEKRSTILLVQEEGIEAGNEPSVSIS